MVQIVRDTHIEWYNSLDTMAAAQSRRPLEAYLWIKYSQSSA